MGLLLLSPGLAALVYGLSEFGIKGGLDHWTVLVGIVAGAVLLVGFVVHALRAGAGALIDLRLFHEPGVRRRVGDDARVRRCPCSARCS